jgi:uncharacterized membrane protein YqiK
MKWSSPGRRRPSSTSSFHRDRYHAEQVELVEAIAKDRQADVRAVEQGKEVPARQKHEHEARVKIGVLRRSEEAAETLKGKAHAELLEVLADAQPGLAESAAKRREQALADWSRAVDALEAAATQIAEASGLVEWAAAPDQRTFRVRPPLTAVVAQNGDRLAVSALVDQLRSVGQAPPKPTIPSPFGTAPPAEQVTETEQAPAA